MSRTTQWITFWVAVVALIMSRVEHGKRMEAIARAEKADSTNLMLIDVVEELKVKFMKERSETLYWHNRYEECRKSETLF